MTTSAHGMDSAVGRRGGGRVVGVDDDDQYVMLPVAVHQQMLNEIEGYKLALLQLQNLLLVCGSLNECM